MERGPSQLEKIAFVYGDVCVRKRKQRRKRQKLLIIQVLYDYAQNSSLHGLRYIVERGLNIIENLFWFITVIVSIVLCSILIYKVYMKWITSPVIVAVNGRLTSVGTVPFPSVTICPQYKVKPSIYNYTDIYDQYTKWMLNNSFDDIRNADFIGADIEKFDHVDSMCDFGGSGELCLRRNLTNSSFVDDITEVAMTKMDIFLYCAWYNSGENCKDLFSRVYTQEGVCYTVNSLAANDIFEKSIQSDYQYLDSETNRSGWSFESGYNYSNPKSYPRRGHVLGSLPDMELILIHDPNDQDKSCNGLYSGYKIYLQHPADFPQSSLYYYAAIPNQVTSLAISFHLFDTDPSLSNYAPNIRQCYFPNDRKLRYFKIYTAKNCQAECLSNYTYEMCHCVGFYMPHHNSSEICSPYQIYCLYQAKEHMAVSELKYELNKEEKGCHCLAECNTIEYDAEVLKTEFKLKDKLKEADLYNAAHSYSRIELFFKNPQFVTMQRRELFGMTDLLANIGGLLGLFLGFSFISLIELFYFLTIRVGFTLKRDLEEERANKKAVAAPGTNKNN